MATFGFSRSIYYVKNNLDLSKNKLGFTKNLKIYHKKMFLENWHYVYSHVCVTIEQRTNSPSQLEFPQPIEH